MYETCWLYLIPLGGPHTVIGKGLSSGPEPGNLEPGNAEIAFWKGALSIPTLRNLHSSLLREQISPSVASFGTLSCAVWF